MRHAASLQIVVVGGLDRVARDLRRMAEQHHMRLEHHDGWSSRSNKRSLSANIARCDLVVIVTSVNSHAAVWYARDRARRFRVPSLICRRFGVEQLSRLLPVLSRPFLAGDERLTAANVEALVAGTFVSRRAGGSDEHAESRKDRNTSKTKNHQKQENWT